MDTSLPTRSPQAAEADQLLQRLRLVDAGVSIGRFAGFDDQNQFLVVLAEGHAAMPALSTVGLTALDLDAPVVVSLERGDPRRPVILGRALRHGPSPSQANAAERDRSATRPSRTLPIVEDEDAAVPSSAPPSDADAMAKPLADSTTVTVDGKSVVLKAERQIELRCGEASILLTAAGKILIRGTYVLSRSRGANRIKGAFVDIN